MPFNKKEWSKQYNITNREKKKEWSKQYNITNREKLKEKKKIWNKNNQKYYREYQQQWRKDNPEKSHKRNTIDNWKQQGIIDGDLSSVYDYFITQTHCWICDMKYNKSYKRCLDHDHDELVNDNIRYICCHSCNIWVVG